jgi:hypothetical protein
MAVSLTIQPGCAIYDPQTEHQKSDAYGFCQVLQIRLVLKQPKSCKCTHADEDICPQFFSDASIAEVSREASRDFRSGSRD